MNIEWFIAFSDDRFLARTSDSFWRREEWTKLICQHSPCKMGIEHGGVDFILLYHDHHLHYHHHHQYIYSYWNCTKLCGIYYNVKYVHHQWISEK
jgi:hypothetical protein